jgi:CRP/FNR family transcriptional regulator, cyclic AMP receptor protein
MSAAPLDDELHQKMALLSSSPLFEMLSNEELTCVAELLQPLRLAAGQHVFEEGELGDCLYVIGQGEIEVQVRDPAGEQRTFALLTPPEFFGEMSVLDKEHRSASARARTHAELLFLSAGDLAEFRRRYPDGFTYLVINIAKVLSARLREANSRLACQPS